MRQNCARLDGFFRAFLRGELMSDLIRPPGLRTDTSNAFAHNTMRVRSPRILRDVRDRNPDYPPAVRAGLDALAEALEANAPMPMIDPLGPDADGWAAAYAPHAGETWLGTEWFFAEIFMYRHLMDVVRWFETGRDPFLPNKAEELRGDLLWELLGLALDERGKPMEERLGVLLEFALWGNRIDLSHAEAMAHGGAWTDEDLLVDDRLRVIERLANATGDVHIIADNAGTEMAMDMALVDALLDDGARRVVVHVKMHPQFVSDTIPADLIGFIRLLGERGGEVRSLGERLLAAFEAGRLRIAPDFFWNSTQWLWEAPPRLSEMFTRAALVISKGDLNYRRLAGDAWWPHDTPYADVVRYFPVPLLALRTLKSDAIVGLPAGLDMRLNREDADWRTNGKRGLIQCT
jgi:hypothetical protein